MVLSEILKSSNLQYEESNQLDKKDKDHSSALYIVELLAYNEYIIALGAPRLEHADKGVVYYPIYLMSAKNRIKAKIGVFEVETAKTISLVDDDGDIDLNKLGDPLLFTFVTKEYLDKYGNIHKPPKEADENQKEEEAEAEAEAEAEEEEEEEEEDIVSQLRKQGKEKQITAANTTPLITQLTYETVFVKEDPLPTTLSWPTESDEDAKKLKEIYKKNKSSTGNWVENFMKNKEYKIHPVESNGDCFFATVRDAFAQIGYKTSVAKLRKFLSQEVTVELYQNYKEIYDGIAAEKQHAEQEIQRLEKVNKELKLQSEKTNHSKQQQDILNEAVKTKQDYAIQKMQKGGADELLAEFGFMRQIHSVEELKEYVQTADYWVSSWGISQLELLLSVKFIILEKSDDIESVIRCTQAQDGKEAYIGYDPKYYIMVYYTTTHYELISYRDKKIFSFGEVPYDMKVKLIKSCVENNENIYYAKIPAFRQFRGELGIPEKSEHEKDEDTKKDADNLTTHLFDPKLVLSFHANSALAQKPGMNNSDSVPILKRNEFAVLNNFVNWRRKLDDQWADDPFTIPGDGTRWNSVAIYLLAVPFKESHPAVYAEFSDNSKSEISKDIVKAKATLKRGGKYNEVAKKNAALDESVIQNYRKDALRGKFDFKTDMGRMLKATNHARLNIFKKVSPPETDFALMEIRAEGNG
jgi:hypothetical protein